MAEDPGIREECEATFIRLTQLYGDRLTAEMREDLRESVGTVVKTVTALRSVPLDNGAAPLPPLVPYRGEG